MTPESALQKLFKELFATSELRAWLRLGDREQQALADAIPEDGASKDEAVSELVLAMKRRGLVGPALFLSLLQVRPRRSADILAVATSWQVTLSPDEIRAASGSETSPLSGLSRPEMVSALEELLVERERLLHGGRIPVDLGERIDDLVRRVMAGGRPKAGDVVAGARLRKPIGNGNFGTIWLADGPEGVELAVKIFHLEKLAEGVMLWRFRRSIKAMAHLSQHRDAPRTIARLTEVAPDGLAFSMPYFPGGNLEAVAQAGWSLPVKLERFLEICRAVAFAHRVGIIHRDIKPANVVLDEHGRPVLTDFDISDIKFATKLSVAGGLGTPIFAAPEQLELATQADERSDIYSLGRLLHFLLLERSPGYQDERDPSLTNLGAFPEALVAIVRRACQWDPRRRYPDVAALIRDVEQCQSGWAAARAHARRAGRWVRYNWALLLVAGLVSGGSLGGYLWQRKVAEEQRQAAERESTLSQQLRDALAQLTALGQRQEELIRRGVDLASQLAGLQRDREAWAAELEKGGQSEAERATLAERIRGQDELIASVEAQIAQNQAAQVELQRKLTVTRQLAQAGQGAQEAGTTPPVVQVTEQPVPREAGPAAVASGQVARPAAPEAGSPCGITPSGGPTGQTKVAIPGSAATIRFVTLSEGRFCMGSAEGVGDAKERPQHVVSVSAFAIGMSEVTQAQWRAVVEAAQKAKDPDARGLKVVPSSFKGSTLPVESVSWCDAARFANVLSRLESLPPAYPVGFDCEYREEVAWEPNRGASGYRLPTEAEWEYAARAGTTTAYATGNAEADLARAGWYESNSGSQTRKVCTAVAKPWGLCDLHGNVWEWTWDRYGGYSSAKAGDPAGPARGGLRVLRGGSWFHSPDAARSAYRLWGVPSVAFNYVGFRLVVPVAVSDP